MSMLNLKRLYMNENSGPIFGNPDIAFAVSVSALQIVSWFVVRHLGIDKDFRDFP